MITIRPWRTTDEAQIKKLFIEFGHYLAGVDDLHRSIVGRNYAKHFYGEMVHAATGRSGKIFVAEENKKIIGFIAGSVHRITKKEATESIPCISGRILELFVTQSYRGKGVGKKLMKTIEEFFRARHCDTITVEVFAPNHSARKFYAASGYNIRDLNLIKVLHS